MSLKQISPGKFSNVFDEIGKKWMLITAGDGNGFNSMTASWGGLGVMWNKDISIAMVRRSRYTFEFIERLPLFTLSFYEGKHRPALNMFGSRSGRDTDKLRESGFTPIIRDDGAVYYEESALVLVCRKLYSQDILPENFIDKTIDGNFYSDKDYHRLYFSEIVDCLA